MRLQQPIYAAKPVDSIKLRITATDVPTSAAVRITDVQLQPGELPTGVVPNPREVGTTPGRWQFRNGVVNPGLTVVALSNADKAAPVRLLVENASGQTTIGSYRFGTLSGSAHADAKSHAATDGWGRAPVVTERQDLTLRTDIENRLHARLMWNERS
ncbi:hypothetical protein [Glutamicibacter nicotianae]|uniref:hypothetical protein n=1 Tax=Glutamicibacter nicotianae TaxID=37929 RepID=UPI0025565DF2|nr:hypothetical protein [Glutamicibacter nicotianae]WIV44541.1 hypothetical protein QQS42_02675 [Glutamicibacter nicotianae]